MFKTLKNETVISVYKPVDLPIENYEELAQELDVINLAKQQARRGLPDTRATGPDANELQFKAKLKNKAIQVVHSVEVSISALKDKIHSLSVSKARAAAVEAASTFQQQINAEFSPRLRDLENLKSDYSEAVDDVNSFKRTHRLRRASHYPDSNWMTASILLFALILESGLNGNFFAAGVDTGLVGGILQASIIAVINIGFGFLVGWWVLPYKNHTQKYLVFSMLGFFLLCLFISAVFNLLVGHYRDALVIDPDNAGQVAIESFTNGILSINDFNSWVLFAIGLLFFALAVYKGYSCDDPYPGYGRVARKKKSIEDSIGEERQEIIEDVEEMHQNIIQQLDDNYDSILQAEKSINSLSSTFDQQNRILKNYVSHLEDALGYIISLYRDTNVSERENEPPMHYSENYIASLECDELNISYRDRRNEIEEVKLEVSNLLPSLRARMLESKEKYHERINGICQL